MAARLLLDPPVKGLISLQAGFIDARFVYRQGLKPSLGSRIVKYPALILERASRRLSAERQDLVFERFNRRHPIHYGPSGRGYQAIAGGSPADRQARYDGQLSRLSYFVDLFPDLLHYADGDSYADLGCGTGQNIRFLAGRFPSSVIIGTDLNADAVALVGESEKVPGLRLSVGDMRSDAFLDQVLADGVDHIVLSHVFSLIIGDSREETKALRQHLVDRLVASSRKTVVIVDNFGARDHLSIAIEQRQRAIVTDDVMSYFAAHVEGRTVMAQSDTSQAVMFSRLP